MRNRVYRSTASAAGCVFNKELRPAFPKQQPNNPMARGSKKSYTSKQKRKAAHIEEGYEKRGVGKGEAEERAWRTVNKQDGGGKKSRSKSKTKKSTSRAKKSSSTSRTRKKSSTRSGSGKKRRSTSKKK